MFRADGVESRNKLVAALELIPPPRSSRHRTAPAIGGTVHDPPILRYQTQPPPYLPAPACHRRIHPAVPPYHPKLTQTSSPAKACPPSGSSLPAHDRSPPQSHYLRLTNADFNDLAAPPPALWTNRDGKPGPRLHKRGSSSG